MSLEKPGRRAVLPDARLPDARLARIAELVGRPVETFRGPEGDALGDALELVKLWERIDATGRARVLACARTEAGRAGEAQQSGYASTDLRGTLR
jgi:hypothetical protein